MRMYIDRTVTPSRESRANKFTKAIEVRKEKGGMAGADYLCGEDGCATTAFRGMNMISSMIGRLHFHGGSKLQCHHPR